MISVNCEVHIMATLHYLIGGRDEHVENFHLNRPVKPQS